MRNYLFASVVLCVRTVHILHDQKPDARKNDRRRLEERERGFEYIIMLSFKCDLKSMCLIIR